MERVEVSCLLQVSHHDYWLIMGIPLQFILNSEKNKKKIKKITISKATRQKGTNLYNLFYLLGKKP